MQATKHENQEWSRLRSFEVVWGSFAQVEYYAFPTTIDLENYHDDNCLPIFV